MSENRTLNHRIAILFSAKLNLEVPSTDTDLLEAGLLDSLTFVDLLLCLEQEFGARVSLEELEIDNFRSIEKIAEYVTNRNGLKASG